RQRRVARRHHAIEMVYAVEWLTRNRRTCGTRGGDLRVGFVGRKTEASKQRRDGGIAIEQPRKGYVLKHADPRAAKGRYVSRHADAEMVVKDTPTSAQHRFCVGRPGDAKARRQVLLVRELRVVIPTQTEIERQCAAKSPVILSK